MNSKRLIWIDVLKFLAIFGIIVIHVSSGFLSDEFLFSSIWYQAVCINSLFRFSIILFIMASGYLILRKQQPLSVIPKRIKRVLLLFIFWLIVYAIIKIIFKGASGSNVSDSLVYIANGFLNPTIVSIQFWYVYMILGLYVLSPILSKWIQNASIKEIEYFICIWVIFSLLQFFNVDSILIDYFKYFTGAIGYFILGYYLAIKKSPFLHNRKNGVVLFIVGSLITIVGTILLSYLSGTQSLFFIKLGEITPGACLQAIGLYIIVINTNFDKLSNRLRNIIEKISIDSYGIYLANVLVFNFLELIHLVNGSGFTALKLIFYSIVVLIISYICIEIMARIPFINKFSGK